MARFQSNPQRSTAINDSKGRKKIRKYSNILPSPPSVYHKFYRNIVKKKKKKSNPLFSPNEKKKRKVTSSKLSIILSISSQTGGRRNGKDWAEEGRGGAISELSRRVHACVLIRRNRCYGDAHKQGTTSEAGVGGGCYVDPCRG